MKASPWIAGFIAFSVSFVAAGGTALAAGVVHKKKLSSYEQQPAVPCLVGTERCAAKNDPPVKACHLAARSSESCSTEGVKVIEAYAR
jgi:hypothetical protein